eukprot:jgi/Psemu1/3524/gm1.3524_g
MIGESRSNNDNNTRTSSVNPSPLSSPTSILGGNDEEGDNHNHNHNHNDSNNNNNNNGRVSWSLDDPEPDAPSQRPPRKHSLVLSDDQNDGDDDEEEEDDYYCPDHPESSFLLSKSKSDTSAPDNDGRGGGGGGTRTVFPETKHGHGHGHGNIPVKKIEGRSFCAEMILLPVSGVCQGSTADFAEQMDIFMRCQHPLDILGMFHEDGDGSAAGVGSIHEDDCDCDDNNNHNTNNDEPVVQRYSGYYAIPRTCEYCGSPDIDLCHKNEYASCERPASFFPRETPPFCTKGRSRWHGEGEGETITNNSVGVVGVGAGSSLVSKQDDESNRSSNEHRENESPTSCSAWV